MYLDTLGDLWVRKWPQMGNWQHPGLSSTMEPHPTPHSVLYFTAPLAVATPLWRRDSLGVDKQEETQHRCIWTHWVTCGSESGHKWGTGNTQASLPSWNHNPHPTVFCTSLPHWQLPPHFGTRRPGTNVFQQMFPTPHFIGSSAECHQKQI